MSLIQAPRHLIAAVYDELIDDSTYLKFPVIAPVAPRRRDQDGWPATMLASLIMAPGIDHGVVGVWATGLYGRPVLAIDETARVFSSWSATDGAESLHAYLTDLMRYPEVEHARQELLRLVGMGRKVRIQSPILPPRAVAGPSR